MTDLYLVIVVLLFALAISDLIVGVSNDAVNFLNSAIGSKVASRRTIMIVASLGIMAGATFSSGMMEVARKGIFNPEFFYFSDIMTIFLAVMITDIILLDLFNTFGMPTSTTVSIVFELLGAAVAVSLIKIIGNSESLGQLSEYINTSSAVLIISGIFLSVLIAFTIGSLVQYLSRLLFTFNVERKMKIIGTLWSGAALAALTYFLLIKGIKGASFVTGDFISMVQENTLVLLLISFAFWSILMYVLHTFLKVKILRIVVLFGTFALAMAFAGNDLVNFIGVPIAGFESYNHWAATGSETVNISMSFLNQPIQTDTYLLVLAGLIMIVTLWFSKKARSVTETEVNLGRQDEGNERFKANLMAKGIVRYSIAVNTTITRVVPIKWIERSRMRFRPPEVEPSDKAAFDLLRASVNLTVASVLIAIATSFKLPLSTTYVSFMVAMGTSLADKAWGRSSAVYRVSGVINVIGGWFFTAIVAFSAAATFAVCIYYFKLPAIIILVLLAVFMISRTFLLHKKKEKKKTTMAAIENSSNFSQSSVLVEAKEEVLTTLKLVDSLYNDALTGLKEEDRNQLKLVNTSVKELNEKNEALQRQVHRMIRQLGKEELAIARICLLLFDIQQDMIQSTRFIVKSCRQHVSNSMEPVSVFGNGIIDELSERTSSYMTKVSEYIAKGNYDTPEAVLDLKTELLNWIENSLDVEMMRIREGKMGMRNSLLIFNLFLETKDLVAIAARFAKLFSRVNGSDLDSTMLLSSKR